MSIGLRLSPFFSLCVLDTHQQFTFLTIFPEISCLSFIFRYIFRIIFTSDKVFTFLKLTRLLLVIFLKFIINQKEKRGVYLARNFRVFFISNTFDFFIRKKEVFFENSCSWIFHFSQVKVFIASHLSKIYLQLERKA